MELLDTKLFSPELARPNPKTKKITFSPHEGQLRAWNATERFIAIIAGTQSGKTSFGPHWLYREIKKCGPGDYMVVGPTLPLLKKKAIPEFLKVFRRWLKLGSYNATDKIFTFSPEGCRKTFGKYDPEKPTVVFFGYATDPDSLESATAKAAWLDEPGQKKFKLESWQAILRRLALAAGRVLLTTTPYDLGWLKQQIYDRWKRRNTEQELPGDKDYCVVNFKSVVNPQFSQAEFDRAKQDLPKWKFDLFYCGIFTKPAGMIYDCFNDEYDLKPHPHNEPLHGHKCKPFTIPDHWPRFVGADFGGVNTVLGIVAENPDSRPPGGGLGSGRIYLYKEYKAGSKTAGQHTVDFLLNEPRIRHAVGGAKSEENWRMEFTAAGLKIEEPPIWEVEVGINRVWGLLNRGELVIFDTCVGTLAQLGSYSRVLDPSGEPTEEIEDKSTYHYLDMLRYLASYMRQKATGWAQNAEDLQKLKQQFGGT